MTPARFDALAARVADATALDFTLYGAGERSDFVRFNHGKVRQAGAVAQAEVTVQLIDGRRHASFSLMLSGDAELDDQRLRAQIAELEATVALLPEDPHLLLPDTVHDTVQHDETEPPDAQHVASAICAAAEGTDFVGIYAGGVQWRAFANRRGQRNWFQATSFHLDYSLVHSADKAVKSSLAGSTWSDAALAESLAAAKVKLAALALPPRRLPPGRYRAYLAPSAMAEVLELVSRGGFSAQSQELKVSMLGRLVADEVRLDPRVALSEDSSRGLGPRFTPGGFVKPDCVELVRDGAAADALVSPRSALEFGRTANGSDAGECPRALVMAAGDLDEAEVLERLGTGVYVSDLWYLNHSDRNAGRFTGMTRFATLWVEDGQIVGPLDVMRFDATLFELLGEDLEALSSVAVRMPSASTYHSRSTEFVEVPGALVRAFPLTL